jgi:hypothetical protein
MLKELEHEILLIERGIYYFPEVIKDNELRLKERQIRASIIKNEIINTLNKETINDLEYELMNVEYVIGKIVQHTSDLQSITNKYLELCGQRLNIIRNIKPNV